jgi:hypothetical protein
MKRTLSRLTHLRLAALAAATVFAAPAANAFTYETKSYTDDNGLPRYTDPDKKVEQFENGKVPTPPPGGTTFHFSVWPSNDGFDRGGQFAPAWGPQPFPDGR